MPIELSRFLGLRAACRGVQVCGLVGAAGFAPELLGACKGSVQTVRSLAQPRKTPWTLVLLGERRGALPRAESGIPVL